MEQSLMERCELFIENKEILRKGAVLQDTIMHALCAIICGKEKADIQKVKDCKKIIKSQTSAFSAFRQTTFLALATMLSLEDDPEGRMMDIRDTYSVFKKNRFWGSDYLALSSFLIREPDHQKKEWLVEKAHEIYLLARESHPFLTTSEDYGYAVMLALSELSPSDAIRETDHCYDILKSNFLSKDAVQALSFVLALGAENADEKCEKTMRLFDGLKQNGYKYGANYELPGLGLLALSSTDEKQTVADVIAVHDYLKTQKGFGALGIRKSQRLLFASALAIQESVKEDTAMAATLTTTYTNIVVAIQLAIIAAIAATSAAAAASSSHS